MTGGEGRTQDEGVEHLLVLPSRDLAEQVAGELEAQGLREIRVVREALSGEDDAEDHEWAVWVRTPGEPGYAARLGALARDHDGWYDPEPSG